MSTTTIRRGAWGSTRTRLVAAAVALALVITGSVFAQAPSAWADNYPSWSDVEAARSNEAATSAAVEQIKGILSGLQAEVARTQADAAAKGDVWQKADIAYQGSAAKAATLQQQADAASTKATASEQRAGQMAAQIMRSGGEDLTVRLLLDGVGDDSLLDKLGLSEKITLQAKDIYERAAQDRNTAQALTDQADRAKAELKVLQAAAEAAFLVAQTSAQSASDALNAQLDNQARLEQQLVVLTQNRAATEADYMAGVKERFKTDAGLDVGEISDSGWVKPAGGYITSVYGWSEQYGTSFHKGTDLGAGCGANIYAASGGTVTWASYGWNGGYGNMIMIDHGNGVSTRYGHIVADGILVSMGQSVGVGENIAKVGSTGNSTGCHLHFEVIINGNTTDPVPFMAGQGINLG